MAEKEKGKDTKSSVDEQTQGYFKRVKDVIDEDDFDDDEHRRLFVANVFTQVQNNELSLSCDQTVSIVMEQLLVRFSEVQIRTMLQNLRPEFRVISTDKCGSHVLESLIKCIPRVVRSERERTMEDTDLESAESLFLQFCGFVKENLTELLWHTYGSHVVRTMLEVLGGVRVADSIVRSRASRAGKGRNSGGPLEDKFHKVCPVGSAFGSSSAKPSDALATPESFHPILRKLAKKLLKTDLEKLTIHSIGSPVLQTLLLVLHKRDTHLCYKLCKAIMEQCNLNKEQESSKKNQEDSSSASYKVPALFAHESGSHVVEKILHVVSPELHSELYSTFFKGHLPQLVEHPIANYIVQHLLASCTDKAQAESVVAELLDLMEDILALGHVGIIVRIVEVCVRHRVQQESVTQAVLSAFHCAGQEECCSAAALITSLTTYDVYFGQQGEQSVGHDEAAHTPSTVDPRLKSVNYHGAMLIKSLFEFDKPEVFADSLVGLSCGELVTLCGDVLGSFVAEAFLKSPTVSVRKKHKFIKKLKGTFTKLACEKHASHVVDTCWRQAEMKYKEKITAELAESEAQLNNNFYGRIVLKNCGTEQFKKNNRSLLEKQDKATRKRKMLDEILRDDVSLTNKTKNTGSDASHDKNQSAAMSHQHLSKYSSELEALGFGEDDGREIGTEATEKMEQGARLNAEYNAVHELSSGEGHQQGTKQHSKRKKLKRKQSKHEHGDVNFIVNAIEATTKKKRRKEKRGHEA